MASGRIRESTRTVIQVRWQWHMNYDISGMKREKMRCELKNLCRREGNQNLFLGSKRMGKEENVSPSPPGGCWKCGGCCRGQGGNRADGRLLPANRVVMRELFLRSAIHPLSYGERRFELNQFPECQIHLCTYLSFLQVFHYFYAMTFLVFKFKNGKKKWKFIDIWGYCVSDTIGMKFSSHKL